MMLEVGGGSAVGPAAERLAKCPALSFRFPVCEGLHLPRAGPWAALVACRALQRETFGVVVGLLRSWRPDLLSVGLDGDRESADGRFGLRDAARWLEQGEAVALPGHRPAEVAWAVACAGRAAVPLFFVHCLPTTPGSLTAGAGPRRDRAWELGVSRLLPAR